MSRSLVLLGGVGECGLGPDELRTHPSEVAETELRVTTRRRGGRVHHLAETCEHGRVDAVGLAQLAKGLGEAPCLQRADDRDPEAGIVKTAVQLPVIAAGGLDDDEFDPHAVQ